MYGAIDRRVPGSPARGPRARFHLALLLLAAPLLSGCILIDVAFVVRDDGTALFSQLVALDSALTDAAPGIEAAVVAPVANDLAVLFDDPTVTAYDESGWRGWLLQGNFATQHTDALILLLSGREVVPPGGDGPALSIVRQGDGWQFDAIVPPPDPGGTLIDEGPIAAGARFTVRVLLPGRVASHNADRLDGDVLIWDIAFDQSSARALTARSEPGTAGDGPGFVLVPLGVLALVAASGAAAWWWLPLGRFSRRRDSAEPRFIASLRTRLRRRPRADDGA